MRALVVAVFLSALTTHVAVHAQASSARPAADRQQQAPAFQAKTLTRADLDALLQTQGDVLLVDVRRPDELQSIGGFPVYLSVQLANLEKQLALIPRERTIVTVSNHANRAGRAADLLTAHGFRVAGAIGAQDYEAEGGQLVKVAAPARTAPADTAAR